MVKFIRTSIFQILVSVGFPVVVSSCDGQPSGTDFNITAEKFLELRNENAVIIDVRTDQEFRQGHVKDAISINIHSADFSARVSQLDRNTTYYVYCHTGVRSKSAVKYMRQSGFTKAFNVTGGILDLAKLGENLVK